MEKTTAEQKTIMIEIVSFGPLPVQYIRLSG